MKNNISYLFCLLITGLLSLPALAKKVPQEWEQGVIYLENQTLQGSISYDPKHDVVFYKLNGQIQTFSAHAVDSFAFYDEEAGITRTFTAQNTDGNALQGRKEFYEIVVEGDLTLARKGRFTQLMRLQGNINPLPSLVRMANQSDAEVVYDYYLMGERGLTEVRHFRKQVLSLMADREKEMQQFVREFNFNFSNPLSYILLINYYNQLKKGVLAAQWEENR